MHPKNNQTKRAGKDRQACSAIDVVSLRLVRERSLPYKPRSLTNSTVVYDLFRELVEDLDREMTCLVCLDTKNKLTCLSVVSVGTVDSASVHPREVFKVALLSNASGIIFVHNHPSGDPEPSDNDRAITRKLQEAGQIMGIKVLDHIIIGNGCFYSFADSGIL